MSKNGGHLSPQAAATKRENVRKRKARLNVPNRNANRRPITTKATYGRI